ncbi:MAG: hypothetical protein CMO82_13985 [Winogradskyella sp.]|nr:hypothetical protein [Winogradskyella sp.]|tara:strand:- start:46 stop:510 length:465 start_codon:yes stop_codon:yes gene_type:complete
MQLINNETKFENHIRQDILTEIITDKEAFKLFNFKKAVDVLIAKNGKDPKLFFIEIKYHKKSHGRLGFGQGKGAGFQPEVLKDKTTYFENNMRWILGHEDSEQYWFVDNDTIRQYLNGDKVGEKYNGIKIKFFREVQSMSKEALIINISNWLSS